LPIVPITCPSTPAVCCRSNLYALSHQERAKDRPFGAGSIFGGNRRINRVLYIACVTQQRVGDEARVYIDRKTGEGQAGREARRSHKRHLANRVIRRMWQDESSASTSPIKKSFDKGVSQVHLLLRKPVEIGRDSWGRKEYSCVSKPK
jgi:hypothetical protein